MSNVCYQALFAAYSGPLRRIHLPQLQLLISHAGFDSIPDPLKIPDRDIRLCFFWSCMFNADSLKSTKACNSLSFPDFLECIARLADALSLPGEEQLIAIGVPVRRFPWSFCEYFVPYKCNTPFVGHACVLT